MADPQVLGACPIPPPSVGGCWSECDQCPTTQRAWSMLPFAPFGGLSPKVLWAKEGCEWVSDTYLECDQFPGGMAAVWYVQVLDAGLGLSPGVITPDGGCGFTSCCPGASRGVVLP